MKILQSESQSHAKSGTQTKTILCENGRCDSVTLDPLFGPRESRIQPSRVTENQDSTPPPRQHPSPLSRSLGHIVGLVADVFLLLLPGSSILAARDPTRPLITSIG